MKPVANFSVNLARIHKMRAAEGIAAVEQVPFVAEIGCVTEIDQRSRMI